MDLASLAETAKVHPLWSRRNIAVKAIGSITSEQARDHLLEIVADRRPSSWWRRCMGDPLHQVGFIRRNAWQGLYQQEVHLHHIRPHLDHGLSDAYYEVRAACWKLLARCLQEGHETSPGEKEKWEQGLLKENNVEILEAGLGCLERVVSPDRLMDLASHVNAVKHWRVRAAYLEAMERLSREKTMDAQRLRDALSRFNMRSEYFRPIFMLKEKGAQLEKVIREST